jgi:hypothetical protein
MTGMSGRGDSTPRADADDETVETGHEELVERLRSLEWPKPEPGEAERAFERFRSSHEDRDD